MSTERVLAGSRFL